MYTNEDDSGFETDSDNNIYLNEVRSRSSSSSPMKVPESVKAEVIPCIPLAHSGISLEPDMLFGWRPKNLLNGGPIPLSFTAEIIPSKNCIFYGYRPEDSLEFHEDFSSPKTYTYYINPTVKQVFKVIKKTSAKRDCRPFVNMKPDIEESLKFDSKFESGNLDKVCKVKEDEYDLYIRNDSNTYGKNQWFNFTIANTGEEREVKFNIVNFCKQDSLYTQGLQPCIFRPSQPHKGWHYMCENVKYSFSKINKTLVNKRIYYSLSFTLKFPSRETLHFAYSIPYTYSDLLKFLECIGGSKYLKREILCKSLSGVDVPLLTITDLDSREKKECVIVTARVHPGETHGSWVMQGFLSHLLSSAPDAIRLRQLCLFKIVPMLNPDGVIVGNARCSLNGQDLNRQFQHPDHLLHPEIYHLKNLILGCKDVLAYLDFHAHSRKKGVFFYGPYFPLHSENHCKIRVIPKLLSENTEVFRYYSCKFRNDWSKRKAARLVMSKESSLAFSYTVEASSFGYIRNDRTTIVFNPSNLQEMGQHILYTILQYIHLRNEEIRQKEIKAELRSIKSLRLSPIKDSGKPRTMNDLIEFIKKDLENEDENNSGGSDSDSINEQEEEKVNKKILTLFKKVNRIMFNPTSTKRYSHSQAPKSSKNYKKNEDFDYQAKSTLAKYFSRACTDNKNKLRFRTESVKRPLEGEKKSKQVVRSRENVSKFSYSKGLYALKPKGDNLIIDRSVLKSKRQFRLVQKATNHLRVGDIVECLDDGYRSGSESESKKLLEISKAMKKNSKYQSSDKIN